MRKAHTYPFAGFITHFVEEPIRLATEAFLNPFAKPCTHRGIFHNGGDVDILRMARVVKGRAEYKLSEGVGMKKIARKHSVTV